MADHAGLQQVALLRPRPPAKARPCAPCGNVTCRQACAALQADTLHTSSAHRCAAASACKLRAVGVVDVHHGGAQAGPVEQGALGQPVVGHAAVVVQVVLREVGEQRHADPRARQAVLGQANRRGLDGAGAKPRSANWRKARCRRTGSGVVMPVVCSAGGTPTPKVPTSAQPASAGSSFFDSKFKASASHQARAGLAIGAGHGQHLQAWAGCETIGRPSRRWRP